jgi:hypothetical protein
VNDGRSVISLLKIFTVSGRSIYSTIFEKATVMEGKEKERKA